MAATVRTIQGTSCPNAFGSGKCDRWALQHQIGEFAHPPCSCRDSARDPARGLQRKRGRLADLALFRPSHGPCEILPNSAPQSGCQDNASNAASILPHRRSPASHHHSILYQSQEEWLSLSQRALWRAILFAKTSYNRTSFEYERGWRCLQGAAAEGFLQRLLAAVSVQRCLQLDDPAGVAGRYR